MPPCAADVRISVVVPALDEGENVGAAVASAREADEVIVVDGGSSDDTAARAAAAGARVVPSARGRGVQQRTGAETATGDWLVFLHADTRLDPGFSATLRALPGDVAGGAFRLVIDAPGAGFRLVEAAVSVRCRLFRLPYGDQAIFARRRAYDAAGGMPPLPLMEDVAFVHALRRRGRLVVPALRARTSARRWHRHGIVGTTVRNWALLAAWRLGVSPERLARLYR